MNHNTLNTSFLFFTRWPLFGSADYEDFFISQTRTFIFGLHIPTYWFAQKFSDKLMNQKYMNLSPSCEPSPSLDILEVCLTKCRTSSGNISSLLCTVNELFILEPNPSLRFRPYNETRVKREEN